MKQQYFSISDSLGGAEQVMLQLAKVDIGNSQVCFFKSKTTDIWEQAGIKTYYCNGSFIEFLKFCRNLSVQQVFSTHLMINSFLGILRTLKILKVEKLVCRESTSVFGRYNGMKLLKYKIAYWLGYRNIDLLITQSDMMKDVLLQNVPYLNNRTEVQTIPNLFVFPEVELVNEKVEIPSDSLVLAGRLIPEKGFDIMIDVFSELLKEFPQMNLVILGEGEQRQRLEQQITELQLNDKVHLLGFVKNVYPYFRQAKVCVVSSRKEGFPNVLLQMMSQNERVVSTLCAGGIDKIKDVEICQPNDKQDLYNAIKRTIQKPLQSERFNFDRELQSRSVESFNDKVKSLCK